MKYVFIRIRVTRILAGLSLMLLSACQQRLAPPTDLVMNGSIVQSNLQDVGAMQLDEQPMQVTNIVSEGGSMFMGGQPFGMLKAETNSTPTNPYMSWAVKDQITTFPLQNQAWIFDNWASGGISRIGNLLVSSGTAGLSVVSMANPSMPQEVIRYPQAAAANGVNYVYSAIVAHPSLPIFYGFTRQSGVYSLVVGSGLTVGSFSAYGAGSVCCAVDAVYFNGKIYVAFSNRLVALTLNQSGAIVETKSIDLLHATAVRATANRLYVVHDPAPGVDSEIARGTIVFGTDGKSIARLDAFPPKFAVSADNNYMYAVEPSAVRIFRILW